MSSWSSFRQLPAVAGTRNPRKVRLCNYKFIRHPMQNYNRNIGQIHITETLVRVLDRASVLNFVEVKACLVFAMRHQVGFSS